MKSVVVRELSRIVGVQKILFLCTGNYYRSRMAEEMFNHFAEKRGLTARAFSRGLSTSFENNGNTGSFSSFALRVLTRYGITPRRADEFPQRVTADELRDSDVVIALYQRDHAPMTAEQFPEFAAKVIYWSVPDLDEMSADEAGEMIYGEVMGLVNKF
jgi:protein-tyrosine phosphatase